MTIPFCEYIITGNKQLNVTAEFHGAYVGSADPDFCGVDNELTILSACADEADQQLMLKAYYDQGLVALCNIDDIHNANTELALAQSFIAEHRQLFEDFKVMQKLSE